MHYVWLGLTVAGGLLLALGTVVVAALLCVKIDNAASTALWWVAGTKRRAPWWARLWRAVFEG